MCYNTAGSYLCVCQTGYIRENISSVDCTDLNECDHPVLNICDHNCTNTDGSYSCTCNEGFIWQDTRCVAIIECPINDTEFCEAKRAQCAISRGNVVCLCSKGFEWNSEQRDCIACSNYTYGPGCSEICHCVHNNADNETQACDHVNGTCICKTGWEGRCDRDIDECTRNPQICRGMPNSGCHNTIEGYECSCHSGYVLQRNQCIPVGETVVVMSVKLDVAIGNGVNLNVTATYEYFSNAAKVALVEFYRQRMMDKLKRIEIISLASGSLIIEFKFYIDNTQVVAAILTVTNVELAGASVMFENRSTGIIDVRVAGIKVSSKPSDGELCKLYQRTFATCNIDYMCKFKYGLPSCSQIEKGEYYLTTALAAGIPVGLLLIGAIIVLICVIKRRARSDRRAQDNASGYWWTKTIIFQMSLILYIVELVFRYDCMESGTGKHADKSQSNRILDGSDV